MMFANTIEMALDLKKRLDTQSGKREALAIFGALKRDPVINDFLTDYFEDMLKYAKEQKRAWDNRSDEWQKLVDLWGSLH